MQNIGRQSGSETARQAPDLVAIKSLLVDEGWYSERYPDVASSGLSPVDHYLVFGEAEGRRPCARFDPHWYRSRHADVGADLSALDHYVLWGAQELRDPSPEFDAVFYATQNPDAAANPLLHYRLVGEELGLPTKRIIAPEAYLPSRGPAGGTPSALRPVTVVVPVYAGLAETRRCIESLLSDRERARYRLIVVDDCGPDPDLRAFLERIAGLAGVEVVRNAGNLGFVRSANRGLLLAGDDDVILLNSDTVVPPGWVARLARHAAARPDVASVSPTSNNATICSYPGIGANDLAFGGSVAEVDAAMQRANRGRSVTAPTTVGFCMYIPRKALRAIGPLDEAAFEKGYGEEVDFCRRAAAAGYVNLIAWDVFVFHVGEVSFGAASPHRLSGDAVLRSRYPTYEALVHRFVRLDEALPYRFAATAALFASNGRTTRLIVTHDLGGGVEQHIGALAHRLRTETNIVVASATDSALVLSFPQAPGHPPMAIGTDDLPSAAAFLASAGVAEIEIHHVFGFMDGIASLLALLHPLRYRIVVHDYHYICPQITLTRWPGETYCGEPEAEVCNACIAARHGAHVPDIDAWRLSNASLLQGASRVVFPSRDTAERFGRYLALPQAVVAPHDEPEDLHGVRVPRLVRNEAMRVAILGVLAEHKGSALAIEVARLAAARNIEIHLVGHLEEHVVDDAGALRVTGRYARSDVGALLAAVDPHLVWFPARWPETYSYTLSEAIAARRAVLAPAIGAFPERLEGRPSSWLYAVEDGARDVLACLEAIRNHLLDPGRRPPRQDAFLGRGTRAEASSTAPRMQARSGTGRRRRKAMLIPELLDIGVPTPCAYIRQILPLRDLAEDFDLDLSLSGPTMLPLVEPEILFLQRCSIPNDEILRGVLHWARRRGCRVVYDLDDDLTQVPPDHSGAERHAAEVSLVERLLAEADIVTVSTEALAEVATRRRGEVVVLPNALDGRLWLPHSAPPRLPGKTVRLLYMGTATHAADFDLLAPVLERLQRRLGDRLEIDIIGVTDEDLPSGMVRRWPDGRLAHSYPGFVDWLTASNDWDIGLAPLRDTPFNRCKSPIKAIDYAALGLCTLASQGAAYGGSLADGTGGLLCDNTPEAWFDALETVIRNPALRAHLQRAGHAQFRDLHLLQSQRPERVSFLRSVLT